MNYKQFLNRPNVIERVLEALKIFQSSHLIIQIDNLPDYDITEYKREQFTNYFFHNSFNFNPYFQSITHADLLESYILTDDDLNELSMAYKIPYRGEDEQEDFLLKIYHKEKEALSLHGYGTEVGEFKLNALRLTTIDNLQKRLYYEGSFFGDSSDIDPLSWGIYTVTKVEGIPNSILTLPFYKNLLAESYLLYKTNNIKLAYFIAYSAFDSFIHYELGGDEREIRLKEKLKDLFSKKFSSLEKHQVYNSVMDQYGAYTTNRNTIAHGRDNLSITKAQFEASLLFVLTLIAAYEFNTTTFEDMAKRIK